MSANPDEELQEQIAKIVHAAARKAQLDYYAVNSPNGVRYRENPEVLTSFLETEVNEIAQLIKSREERLVREARVEELDNIHGKRALYQLNGGPASVFVIHDSQVADRIAALKEGE